MKVTTETAYVDSSGKKHWTLQDCAWWETRIALSKISDGVDVNGMDSKGCYRMGSPVSVYSDHLNDSKERAMLFLAVGTYLKTIEAGGGAKAIDQLGL